MSYVTEKLWSCYPGWYERTAPIRSAVIESIARVIGKVHGRMGLTETQMYAAAARVVDVDAGGIDAQPDGPWKVFWVSPFVPVGIRLGLFGNQASNVVGLLSQGQNGQPGGIHLLDYTGPGLYVFKLGPQGSEVWAIIGQLNGISIGYFMHTGRQRFDYLSKVAYERGFYSTVQTGPVVGEVFRSMLLHFIRSKRCGQVQIDMALRLYAGNRVGTQSFREDWTGRIYGGFAYCGFPHFGKRSYFNTLWRTKSQHVARIFVSVADAVLLQGQEISEILRQYVANGIEAVIVPVQSQTGPPPLP